jgi:TolB-like protein/Tfp pilus assembly protein PilF
VILFEMLTGRIPFEGKTPLSIAMKHKSETPPNPKVFNAHIPNNLNWLILKCMDKNKDKRIQSTRELLSEIAEIEEGTSAFKRIAAKKKIGLDVRMHRIRRYLIPAGIVLAAAVIALAFLIFGGRETAQDQPETVSGIRWANSIAVLPFRDFSPAKDQEAFCDAMTDAIIGRVSRIDGLKVISMTSVMNYKSPDRNIKNIGQELNVKTILEGSIQREGNRIRVNAQLIDVVDDSHLWTDSYDRDLSSIFKVQDEISQSIAEALKMKLSLDKGEPAGTTPESLEAYDYYSKGMHFTKSKYILTFQEDDFKAGVEMFEKALEVDKDYAPAYLGLAWAYEHHYQVTGCQDDFEKAHENSFKAYELAPDSAMAIAIRGYCLYEYDEEIDEAFRLIEKALEINPNSGEVNFIAGACLLYHGLYQPAIKYLAKSIELDPYYFWTPYKLAMCYMNTGDFDKAALYFEKYFEIAPIVLIFPGRYIALNIKMEKFDVVEELIARTEETHPDYALLPYCKALLFAAKGEKEKALAMHQSSEVYSLLGMRDEAIQHLDQEIRGEVRFPHLHYQYLLNNPLFDNLRGDSRFKKIVRREKKLYEEDLKKYGNLE